MIIRTKGGEFRVGNAMALLDFLGVKKAAGSQKINGDIELIASVPFRLTANDETETQGIPWTFSTFDLDRYGERMDPEGWDYSQFVKNPVIEWAHRYDIPAIGKADNLYIDKEGLHGMLFFNSRDYDPFGWSIGERVKAGVIRAGSVGFRVIEIEIPDTETAKDGTSLIFRKQELLEFSVCNVPANPFALAKLQNNAPPNTKQGFGSPSFWGNIINNFEGV